MKENLTLCANVESFQAQLIAFNDCDLTAEVLHLSIFVAKNTPSHLILWNRVLKRLRIVSFYERLVWLEVQVAKNIPDNLSSDWKVGNYLRPFSNPLSLELGLLVEIHGLHLDLYVDLCPCAD